MLDRELARRLRLDLLGLGRHARLTHPWKKRSDSSRFLLGLRTASQFKVAARRSTDDEPLALALAGWRNGRPNWCSSSRAWSSLAAEVTIVISMPWVCWMLVGVDLGEDDLFGQAQAVVAMAVEAIGVNAAEVADTRQGDRDQPIEELVHPQAAERDLAADVVSLAEPEARRPRSWPW